MIMQSETNLYLDLSQKDWFTYEVKEIKEVFPNQVEVIAPTPDEPLTLYTCSGYKDQKRLIVISKRIETWSLMKLAQAIDTR